jgi:RNA polymerase sigma-70 factor, ECF subfamily
MADNPPITQGWRIPHIPTAVDLMPRIPDSVRNPAKWMHERIVRSIIEITEYGRRHSPHALGKRSSRSNPIVVTCSTDASFGDALTLARRCCRGASHPHHLFTIQWRLYQPDFGADEKLQLFTEARSAVHHRVTSNLHILRPSNPRARGTKPRWGFPMNDFARMLEAEIPRLRRYACALTRDVTRADDLVQSCLARAIAKQHLWQPGTDLRAWLFTLLHNQNVNDVRRSVREGVNVDIDEIAPVLSVQPRAMASLELRDLRAAIDKLTPEQRQVVLLVGLEGMEYEEVGRILGVPIGTVRSRLSRGRDELRRLMDIDKKLTPAAELRWAA